MSSGKCIFALPSKMFTGFEFSDLVSEFLKGGLSISVGSVQEFETADAYTI